jgi:hypothetical protein
MPNISRNSEIGVASDARLIFLRVLSVRELNDPLKFYLDHPCLAGGIEGSHQLVKMGGPRLGSEDVLGRVEFSWRVARRLCLKCGMGGHTVHTCTSAVWVVPGHPGRDD